MQEPELDRQVFYSNEVSISVGPHDSALTFRWLTPQYDNEKKIAGANVEKEVTISITSELLKVNAKAILELFDKMNISENIDNKQSN
jgi:hypothetical protein